MCSTDDKFDGEDYIETIHGDGESIDKSNNVGPQIVCINSDGEFSHQIEVDEYNEDQLEEDALETPQYEQRLVATNVNSKGLKNENSSVYYIHTPTSNSSMNESQLQSPQRQTKIVTANPTSNQHNDPDERFLLSCVPSLKRLPTKKNSLAKLRIQQLLYELEFEDFGEMSGQ